MLLKAADSSPLALKAYWEELLQEPLPEAQQPKKVEEPSEKKNSETEPAEEPADEKREGNRLLEAKPKRSYGIVQQLV